MDKQTDWLRNGENETDPETEREREKFLQKWRWTHRKPQRKSEEKRRTRPSSSFAPFLGWGLGG